VLFDSFRISILQVVRSLTISTMAETSQKLPLTFTEPSRLLPRYASAARS